MTSASSSRRGLSGRRGCDGCSVLSVERDRLRGELAAVIAERDRLAAQVEKLKTDKAGLAVKLEEARRAAKRQAAPFSRGAPKPDGERKRPGRKPGADYGRRGRRLPPEEPDEEIEVPLPDACPHCGSDLMLDSWSEQFQDELVTAVRRRRYRVALGHCPDCDRAVRGRHPDQTSEALGAAGTMVGPQAMALAAWLRFGCGMPAAKIARLFAELGLAVTAGGITQAMARLAGDAQGAYAALITALRASPVVCPDETGWRVDGEKAWLWAFVGDHVTVYDIAVGRGYDEAKAVLGEGYDGVICRDGWAPYRRFAHAAHQTCLAHLLRRANEMIADSVAGQARIPHAVRQLLHDALALRARRDAAQISRAALEAAIAELEARLDKLLAGVSGIAP